MKRSWLDRLREKPSRLVAGMNSGTSADGVDVAIVEIEGSGLEVKAKLLAFEDIKHPRWAREKILEVSHPETGSVDKICRVNFLVGELFASAVLRVIESAGLDKKDIDLISSHGQTIYHIPPRKVNGQTEPGSTLQIGEPSIIAETTGIATVADFRPRDMAAGGHSVPILAYPDFLLFRDETTTISVQNIGGIANLTLLIAGKEADDVIAFDTGPGNMVIDGVVSVISEGELTYDKDGEVAARGCVNQDLLRELMDDPYFRQPPPKSTGREEFGGRYIERLIKRGKALGLSNEDLVATATALTAESMYFNYSQFCFPKARIDKIVLAGGGALNNSLVAMIRENFEPICVSLIDDYGIPCDGREAVCYAVLGNETIMGNPNNLPAVTGANRSTIVGKILPPGPYV